MGIIKKGKDYYLEYSVYVIGADGKKKRERRRKKVGPFRELAEKAWSKFTLEKAETVFLDKKPAKKLTLDEFSEKYLEYSKNNKKASGHERDQYSLLQLKNLLGETLLEDINMVKVEEYKGERIAVVKPATINRELQCLRALLNVAVEWDILPKNPVKKMRLLKEPPGRVRYLTLDEIRLLIAECASHLRPIVVIAIYTGMRKGEILSLKWDFIDFKNDIIHVEEIEVKQKRGSPKSATRRDVPMCQEVKEALEKIPRKAEKVFCDIIDPRDAFRNACQRAGIENFRFHDLRHTFASHLAIQGVSLLVIKELLGHKTLEMTLRYSHLCPDVKRKAIEKFAEILKNTTPQQSHIPTTGEKKEES